VILFGAILPMAVYCIWIHIMTTGADIFSMYPAAGTLADGLIENDVKQPNDISWDAVWEGSASLNDDGWSV